MNNFKYDLNQRYLVAVSGGPDSMALLNMLYEQGYHLIVNHVNYHHRKESDLEEREVSRYCQKRSIPIEVLDTSSLVERGNFQAWARDVRYQFFKKNYLKYQASGLFVAHQQDDLIETYLMQRRRHNIVSYFGIKEDSVLLDMNIYRPLLGLSKKSLEEYCIDHKIFYSIDSSNLKEDYTRNKIRHQVVEKMNLEERKKILEEIDKANLKLKTNYQKANLLLNREEKRLEDFKRLDEVSQNIFIYLYIKKNLPTLPIEVSYSRFLEIKKILLSPKPNIEVKLKKSYYFVKAYDVFYIEKKDEFIDYEYVVKKPEFVDTPYFSVDLRGDLSPLKIFKESYPLTIRNAKNGDEVVFGKVKKRINRILIDEKVPKSLRNKYPIIIDCRNKVVYIPLYRSKQQKDIANKLKFVIKYSLH